MKKTSVTILGATGLVGRIYAAMLSKHPYFEVTGLTARKSVGRGYSEVVGELDGVSEEVLSLRIKSTSPSEVDSDLVFSSLPTEVAREIEPRFAEAGFPVVSDASAYRMQQDVPLVIPEVNPEHLKLLNKQREGRRWKGFIVTSPNCTAAGLALPLKPLHQKLKIRKILVTTMQAISGAGFNGVAALKIMNNIVPHIEGEEEKVENETKKLLGEWDGKTIAPPEIEIAATCTRVPTPHGHLKSVYVECERDVDTEAVKNVLENFRGLPQKLRLPSAPERPIIVNEHEDRPQAALDLHAGSVRGMSVTVGKMRHGLDARSLRFIVLSHNLVRGAAGNAILVGELLHSMKMIGE